MKKLFEGKYEELREKTDGFDIKLVLFHALMYATWPPMWFFAILVVAETTELAVALSIVVFGAVFGCIWTMYNGAKKEIIWIRDLRPMLERQVDVAKMSLDRSSDLEPNHDPELVEVATKLVENLERQGLEVWSRDGNIVVAEDGCYGAFKHGDVPESAEHVRTLS